MGCQDVAFLPSRASFSTTFISNCGRGESPGITTCLKIVVGGKQGPVTCRILSLHQDLFFMSVKLHEDCHRVEVILANLCLLDITGFKIVVSLCLCKT